MVTPNTMPLFQTESNVIWGNMPYIAWSAGAFSIVSSKAQSKILTCRPMTRLCGTTDYL